MTPKVAIIVLSWNGKDDTFECLKSLGEVVYPNFWTILVDNGSTDGTAEAVRSAFSDVEVIETGQNLGFAGGNNIGIRRSLDSGADAVLLLNNDTVVAPEFLSPLVKVLYRSDDIAAVNPLIYYYDQPDVIWSAGGEIDRRTGIAYQRYLDIKDVGQFRGETAVDYGVGAALLICREAIEKVGLLDPDYFLYYEESDWCFRARDAGYKTIFTPESKIWHKVSRGFEGRSAAQLYYFCRNRLYFLKKRRVKSSRLLRIVLSDFSRMAASMAVHGDVRSSRAVLRGVADFYLGRMGK
ncbi:MAG: glycosyltransferase family 2 protein [Armatimonadota bacterium]